MATPTIDRVKKAAEVHRAAQQRADQALAKRDQLAAKAAGEGVTYGALATAMGITVDGVTYVLRKVRRST